MHASLCQPTVTIWQKVSRVSHRCSRSLEMKSTEIALICYVRRAGLEETAIFGLQHTRRSAARGLLYKSVSFYHRLSPSTFSSSSSSSSFFILIRHLPIVILDSQYLFIYSIIIQH